MTDDELRTALTDALAAAWEQWEDEGTEPDEGTWAAASADALLPVARAYAADQLRKIAAAAVWQTKGGKPVQVPVEDLYVRATALRQGQP